MSEDRENYIVAKTKNGWTVLFNTELFGKHENIEDLARAMTKEGVEEDCIANPEAFSSNGIDYSKYIKDEVV
jgi:dienelactone hydrolase